MAVSASRTVATRWFRRVGAGKPARLQRLDVGFDFHFGAEFRAQRRLQAVGDLMRLAERKVSIDFEIERDRQAPADRGTVT